MLTSDERQKIADIKKRVLSMLSERQQDDMPGKFWDDACERFRYLIDLPDEHFEKLRWHTFHVDGDMYNPYFYGHHRQRLKEKFEVLVRDVPTRYRLSAPQVLGEFGYDFGGHIVNEGTLGAQHTVNVLLQDGLLPKLEKKASREKLSILEIGAGYGGWAYHFKRLLPNSTYFIIDLPETLLLSAAYLSLSWPHKRVYVYEKDSFPIDFGDYDYVLLPNFARVLERLNESFDLVMNIDSFQEMNATQVSFYASFVASHLKKDGTLYSWNKDRQLKNAADLNVTKALAAHFRLAEVAYAPTPKFSVKKLLNVSLGTVLAKLNKRLRKSAAPTEADAGGSHEYLAKLAA